MQTYISLVNLTEQGIRNVKGTVDRAQAVKKAAEAAGGKIIGVWWTLGQYDLVLISEAPNDEVATRLFLATGMQGNVKTCSLRAFSEEEMAKIVKGLP
jgi:uncharacterized protein with GYD domain